MGFRMTCATTSKKGGAAVAQGGANHPIKQACATAPPPCPLQGLGVGWRKWRGQPVVARGGADQEIARQA